MNFIRWLRARWDDAARESRIHEYARRVTAATDAHDSAAAMLAWQHMRAEIDARSPEQVKRMEMARGLR